MDRAITGFERDDEGHWAANLSCGHKIHQRHDPPWHSRPWVLEEAGRAERVGTSMACIRCERRELPQGARAYKQTAMFTEETVPKGLLKDHTTRAGVWGVIRVEEGALAYHILDKTEILIPGSDGIVPPEVPHAVEPQGEVRFSVTFYRR